MTVIDRSALRRSLRLKRKSLSASQQANHALEALQHLIAQPEYQQARHIALYWAADGELDPCLVAHYAYLDGKIIYLPVVRRTQDNRRELVFLRYQPGENTQINHFGIPEPTADAESIDATNLDLILVPLVGVDQSGNRLGMGGGFYDTTFSYKQANKDAKPWLVGFAHQCQLMEPFDADTWDVPMDAWLNETGLVRFR